MVPTVKPLELKPWQRSFYAGERLKAEVQLLAARFVGQISQPQLIDGCSLLQISFGFVQRSSSVSSPFQEFNRHVLNRGNRPMFVLNMSVLLIAQIPNALVPTPASSSTGEMGGKRQLAAFSRAAQLLMKSFPQRPDLPYQLLMCEPTGSLLMSAPEVILHPGQWYSNHHSYLQHLQIAWVQGRYEDMWIGTLRAQIDARYFPISDHHIRGFSIIGEDELCLRLFQDFLLCNSQRIPDREYQQFIVYGFRL